MAKDQDFSPFGGLDEMHCSFCGKSRSQVNKLIQGQGASVFAMNVSLPAQI